VSAVAKLAKCSRSTVIAARGELAAEARKRRSGEPSERQDRAQRFLREQLGRGPKRVSDVEEAAAKAHIEPHALEQARADLGVVASRGNSPGNALSLQWSLPG
jgi:hypothetical protein